MQKSDWCFFLDLLSLKMTFFKVRRHFISAMAKDLSMIISFTPSLEKCSIHLVDLDIKVNFTFFSKFQFFENFTFFFSQLANLSNTFKKKLYVINWWQANYVEKMPKVLGCRHEKSFARKINSILTTNNRNYVLLLLTLHSGLGYGDPDFSIFFFDLFQSFSRLIIKSEVQKLWIFI